jgi:amidohydrolase
MAPVSYDATEQHAEPRKYGTTGAPRNMTTELGRQLLEAAHKLAPSIVADRRAIHANPELRYEEVATAALAAARLRELGYEVETNIGVTGVIGVLRGGKPGRTVLLRADMDALPILEQNEASYASKNAGVMHACGHDGHVAMLMATAKLLAERRDTIPGTIKLMFQPAEEGGRGAPRMMEHGILDGVDAAFAQHVSPINWTGTVAYKAGPAWASVDEFTITLKGRGGHAARPQFAVDPIVMAAHVITALQTLVSRETSPIENAVVTVGSLQSGTAFNVIPDEAVLRGTVRTYNPHVQDHIERRVTDLVMGIASALRGAAEVDYFRSSPPLINHDSGAETVRGAIADVLGEEAAVPDEAAMGGEDFAYVLAAVPGCMYRLGVRQRDWAEQRPIHSSDFEMDETALPLGAAVLAMTGLNFLNGK